MAVAAGVLGVYVCIGGLMAVADSGPDWYHDSVDLASIAMLIPIIWLIRHRSGSLRAGPPGGDPS